ncbi:MAG: DNA repair exonuclease, partial [Deltaproteobacteria bacterium]|nr:DNA repair exonuclease [Deltaproteobacteria bacterium]
MSRLTVLHTAELHLDAPFTGLGRTPDPIAARLRDASLAAWDALVDHALAHDAAAVLCAGGLCAGIERGVRAHARLRDGLARLAAGGVAVAIALGPRDPHDGLAVGDWPAGVTVF